MRSLKKIISDPALWALVLFNLLIIFQYRNDAREYTTIIWIYWCQSVLIGALTFIDLVTMRTENISVENFKINNRPATPQQAKGCLPWFFVFHYGMFHFVYLIFLFVDFNFSDIDFSALRWALLYLAIAYIFFFIQNKKRYVHTKRNIGTLFFIPYLRVVPMHLTIMLPKFFDLQPGLTFLALKMVMDIIGHLVTTPYYWQHELKANTEKTF